MGSNIRRRRLRWKRHVAKTKGERRAIQAMDWSPEGKHGRTGKTREDIRCMDYDMDGDDQSGGGHRGMVGLRTRCTDLHRMY